MNKFYIFGSIAIVLVMGLGFLFGGSGTVSKAENDPTPTPVSSIPKIETTLPSGAEKIEVLHFHATQQCWSCITVGEYALKTIVDNFPDEYQSGKITYKDVDGELLENRKIVEKFRASGSSLFINVIKDGQDHIEEDVTVWRLVNNQSQFINYFEAKIKALL
ncbi:MAG: nitrophenyl compound nitroreductase subunit ArsF family protein [Candidatus Shapirobacteria bacterium]|nr:nitrophenyl compound nitroreductase subunit ArsF family protein [Candidatus Shapirobacteria bacterium]